MPFPHVPTLEEFRELAQSEKDAFVTAVDSCRGKSKPGMTLLKPLEAKQAADDSIMDIKTSHLCNNVPRGSALLIDLEANDYTESHPATKRSACNYD